MPLTSDTYRIQPAREEDVRWAAQLSTRVYEGLDVIPEELMVGWWRANPNGFFTFWHRATRIGNFELLPLRAATMEQFVAGQLREIDIVPGDLVPAAESSQIRDLHWESIVIDPDFTGSRSRMMKVFVTSYADLLARLCPLSQIGKVYAIAASKRGAGVLRRTGLSPIGEASERMDAHPLFCGTVESYWSCTSRYRAASGAPFFA